MSSTFNRRDFLKATSATAAIAGTSCMAGKLGSLDNPVFSGETKLLTHIARCVVVDVRFKLKLKMEK